MTQPLDTTRIGPCVNAAVQRADVDELSAYSVATAHEAYAQRGLLVGLNPLSAGQHICGPALTCLNHVGDNLMLHAALSVAQPGDVLVVATLGESDHGVFGELLATQCQAHGLAGIIIDAGVRDVAEIRAMGFPVWSRTISARGTGKTRPGWVNVPVVCGQMLVNPGDAVIADDDGVVCVAAEHVDQVAKLSRQREDKEAAMRERYQKGELSFDTGGLRDFLVSSGVSLPTTTTTGAQS